MKFAFAAFLAALLLFTRGFLPFHSSHPGHATTLKTTAGDPPLFRRLIFMVVDALRQDFALDRNTSQMHFTQHLIEEGKAMSFIAMASPPTVTMPRLKALTTGTTPGFLDAVLNFNAGSLLAADSWVYQMRYNMNKSLLFYGDDTWLKLFPGDCFLNRSEGVSSFYVQDTVEVDANVTRHLGKELRADDWDSLILHYLGLDHVGHIGGPLSPLMPPKQREMDGIVERIFNEHLSDHPDTLLILLGDHGMNSLGNHGGSSEDETSTAMIFISSNPRMKQRSPPASGSGKLAPRIQQIDLVPTLAELFGLPIPLNNIGVLIEPLLRHLYNDDTRRLLDAIKRNSDQITALSGSKLAIDIGESMTLDERITALFTSCRAISLKLSRAFSDYDMPSMITGLIAMIIMLAMSLISQFRTLPSSLAVVLALYAVSMFSSSFVEEEHEFWFYILNTYWLHLIATNSTQWPQAFLQMLFNRLIYSYNPCGNKHISSTTNFAYLISRHWPFAQTILYALTMQAVCLMLASRLLLSVSRYTRPLTRLFIYALFTAVGALLTVIKHEFIFGNQKLSMTKIIFTRSTYGLILTGILIFKFQKIFLKSFKPNRTQRNELLPVLILLLSLLLTRLPNALPLLLQFIQITWLTRNLQMDQFATLIFIQQHFAFFSAGGNSNAISTIDLSSAYLGLDESQMYLAGLLAFLGTFAAPLVVISSGSSALMAKRYDSNDNGLVQNWWVVGRMISAVALAASVTLFRYHLFIWSVFSPKFLYELVWIFVYQVAVSKLI